MSIKNDIKLLEKYGVKPIPYVIASDENAAISAAKKLGYPVAIKIISPEIEHKTDFGAVKIGIGNEQALKLAYRDIIQNCRSKTKNAKIEGMLIQKMARKGVELIIGGKRDAQFGHMIVLGLGGIYVEIFRDISARLVPLTREDIQEMLSELKSHPLLEGARGKKPINKKAFETLVLKVATLMTSENLKEMDLNPVVCDDKGCDIIDARFIR